MDKKQKLGEIAAGVTKCTCCSLYKRATKPVPGEGNPEAEIMFIGEGPGYWEDQHGIPFCGPSGKLLDRLFQSIGLSREEVWIGNIVKHRAPDNRDPMAEEIEACRSFLDEQIKIINPKVIVTLGRFSMNKFLPGEYISQTHGQAKFVDFNGKRFIVIPMYHPAAGLRNGRIMTELKKDFQKISKFLEGELGPVEETVKEKKQESQQEQLKIL